MPQDPRSRRRPTVPDLVPEVRTDARVALRYHALTLVPLPGDDAELHRPAYAAAWRRTLAAAGVAPAELRQRVAAAGAALARGPTRLRPQVDVLAHPGAGWSDGPLGALERLLAPSHAAAWSAALDATEACRGWFAGRLAERAATFRPLRLAGLTRLVVYLCPALEAAGRATRTGDRYFVAVGLPEDEAGGRAVLLQLLHECCHPLVDGLVDESGAVPDTARRAAGHVGQRRREDAALVLGHYWLAGDPELRAAYVRWAARYRAPTGLVERLAGALDLPTARRAAVLARATEVARVAAG